MSEMFEYDGVQYTKEQCNQITSEFFNPILLNQYPISIPDSSIKRNTEYRIRPLSLEKIRV